MRGKVARAVMAVALGSALALPAQAARVVIVKRVPHLHIIGTEVVEVEPGRGRLHVNVEPNRARVWVDGRSLGRGDKNVILPAGLHTVRVIIGGREAIEKVRVDAGHVTRVKLDLD